MNPGFNAALSMSPRMPYGGKYKADRYLVSLVNGKRNYVTAFSPDSWHFTEPFQGELYSIHHGFHYKKRC